MSDFLFPIQNYLFDLCLKERSLVYLKVDEEGILCERGGNLRKYEFEDLQIGQQAEEQVDFLCGIFPLKNSSFILPKVKIKLGIIADIHFFSGDKFDWVLLLDSSYEARQQEQLQQKYNELNLLQRKYNKLQRLYARNNLKPSFRFKNKRQR
jgi:hypothetical protein